MRSENRIIQQFFIIFQIDAFFVFYLVDNRNFLEFLSVEELLEVVEEWTSESWQKVFGRIGLFRLVNSPSSSRSPSVLIDWETFFLFWTFRYRWFFIQAPRLIVLIFKETFLVPAESWNLFSILRGDGTNWGSILRGYLMRLNLICIRENVVFGFEG